MKWSIIYITAVLAANFTATWFIPLPGFGLMATGTILFGATFTARDYVHHLGRTKVYTMIAIAALASAGLSALGPVSWRIVFASVVAILLSETADTEVYQKLLGTRRLVRIAGSNIVSIPLDTVLFNALAFAGVFTWPVLIAIAVGEVGIKFLVGGIVALWRST